MTKFARLSGASAALALFQGAAALAQTNNAPASGVIETFTRAELQAALDASGATYEPEEGNRTINIEFANGLRANAAIMACEDDASETNCYGTSILATFGAPSGASAVSVAEAITQYNYNENFGRAYLDPDGRISVRLYIISDGGILRENYRRQIELWEQSLSDFTTYLYPEAASDGL